MSDYDFLKMVTGLIANRDKEYLIKCGKGKDKYLNKDVTNGDFYLDTSEQFGYYQTHFKINEIIEIVKKDVLYLDWSRVEFEEVKDDGRNENE